MDTQYLSNINPYINTIHCSIMDTYLTAISSTIQYTQYHAYMDSYITTIEYSNHDTYITSNRVTNYFTI